MKTWNNHHQREITAVVVILAVVVVGVKLIFLSHAATPVTSFEAENGTVTGSASVITAAGASAGSAVKFGTGSTSSCVVTALLVNPCRPWLGADVNGYPGVSGFANGIANHEARIGRQLDVVHTYNNPGESMTSDETTLAKRANTFLMLNWKPTLTWSQAAPVANGGDATVNSQIDAMAASIKAIAPKKMFLTIFHEPENDVSNGGSPGCGTSVTYKGDAGTTAQYVTMWHNVRTHFDADGVTNVVWVMNYMGYSGWDCMVNDLWPGNSYVDWIVWDPYAHTGSTFDGVIGSFYNELTSLSNPTDNYLSKTWGINEWGDDSTVQQDVYNVYGEAKTALDDNTFPRIKLYDIFDNTNGGDFRTDYNNTGVTANDVIDATEQADYNKFANDPNISGPFTGP